MGMIKDVLAFFDAHEMDMRKYPITFIQKFLSFEQFFSEARLPRPTPERRIKCSENPLSFYSSYCSVAAFVSQTP